MQDATIPVVFDLHRGLESDYGIEGELCSVLSLGSDADFGERGEVFTGWDVKVLRTFKTKVLGVLALFEGKRKYAHANQVGSMYSFIGGRDDGPDTE